MDSQCWLQGRREGDVVGHRAPWVALCSLKQERCRKGLLPIAIREDSALARRNGISETLADISGSRAGYDLKQIHATPFSQGSYLPLRTGWCPG